MSFWTRRGTDEARYKHDLYFVQTTSLRKHHAFDVRTSVSLFGLPGLCH